MTELEQILTKLKAGSVPLEDVVEAFRTRLWEERVLEKRSPAELMMWPESDSDDFPLEGSFEEVDSFYNRKGLPESTYWALYEAVVGYRTTDLRRAIDEELGAVAGDFGDDELAYFALTTKVELHVRDKLAWRLHKRLRGGDLAVAREWKRADLAVLERGAPRALLEAKALYGFNAIFDLPRFARYISADVAKARALGGESSEVFVLVSSTHVSTPVPRPLRGVVKYDKEINRALAAFQEPGELRATANHRVEGYLRTLGFTTRHGLGSGSALGLDVELDAWLVGPQ